MEGRDGAAFVASHLGGSWRFASALAPEAGITSVADGLVGAWAVSATHPAEVLAAVRLALEALAPDAQSPTRPPTVLREAFDRLPLRARAAVCLDGLGLGGAELAVALDLDEDGAAGLLDRAATALAASVDLDHATIVSRLERPLPAELAGIVLDRIDGRSSRRSAWRAPAVAVAVAAVFAAGITSAVLSAADDVVPTEQAAAADQPRAAVQSDAAEPVAADPPAVVDPSTPKAVVGSAPAPRVKAATAPPPAVAGEPTVRQVVLTAPVAPPPDKIDAPVGPSPQPPEEPPGPTAPVEASIQVPGVIEASVGDDVVLEVADTELLRLGS